MESRLISFELAKAIRDKGFDEPCASYYTTKVEKHFEKEDGELRKFTVSDEEGEMKHTYTFRKNSKGQPHITLAPTRGQVHDWLQDNHGIYVPVRPVLTTNEVLHFEYTVQSWRFSERVRGIGLTWGQAEEYGYMDALRYVKTP